MYFWLCWVFIAALDFLQFSEWRLLSSCGAQASHRGGLSCCRARALGHVGFSGCNKQAQSLWCMGFAGPPHVESPYIRDRSPISCIGGRIPNQWTIREVQSTDLELESNFSSSGSQLRHSCPQGTLGNVCRHCQLSRFKRVVAVGVDASGI